jgi:hypothetical protein
MENVVIYSGHLEYFTTNGYILWVAVIWYVFPALVCCTDKNLATLFRPTTEFFPGASKATEISWP